MAENSFDLTVIRNLRKKLDITAEEMARRAELTRSTVAKIESGKANPTLSTIGGIANVLGLTTTALLAMIETNRATVGNVEPFALKGIDGNHLVLPGLEMFHLKVEPGAGASFDPQLHENTQETIMVLSGNLEIEIGGQVHILEHGRAISFKALQEHSIRSAEGCSLITVHYNTV